MDEGVWDLRTHRLLRTLPCQDGTVMRPSPGGDVLYTYRWGGEDDFASLVVVGGGGGLRMLASLCESFFAYLPACLRTSFFFFFKNVICIVGRA